MLSRDVRVDPFQMPILERTIVDIREEMALLALDERYTLTEVALRYDVSRPTVRLWRGWFRRGGRAGVAGSTRRGGTCGGGGAAARAAALSASNERTHRETDRGRAGAIRMGLE